jgi:hypothetical protein
VREGATRLRGFRLGGGEGNQQPPGRCRRHEYAIGLGCGWPPNLWPFRSGLAAADGAPLAQQSGGRPKLPPNSLGRFRFASRTFNTGNAGGWNDDDMRGARRCLEHGKASIKTVGDIDLCARKRDADVTVGRQAHVMEDEPQLTSIGCRYRMRLTCDHSSDQAHGCSEFGNLAQEGAGPKYCLSPN